MVFKHITMEMDQTSSQSQTVTNASIIYLFIRWASKISLRTQKLIGRNNNLKTNLEPSVLIVLLSIHFKHGQSPCL